MSHTPKQHGNSDRGPNELDDARKNLGRHVDDVTVIDEGEARGLSSGRTEHEEREHGVEAGRSAPG